MARLLVAAKRRKCVELPTVDIHLPGSKPPGYALCPIHVRRPHTACQSINRIVCDSHRVVFILWGGYARKKKALIDTSRHVVIESPHPSPLSAHNGFFGSKPFSRANAALVDAGLPPVEWCLTD